MTTITIFSCPYCGKTTGKKKFSSWRAVATHTITCKSNNGSFKISSTKGPIVINIKKHWDTESIIISIRTFYSKEHRIPAKRDFVGADYPSHETVRKYFGSWNAAIIAAGFSTADWTKESIIESIQSFFTEYNRAPLSKEFKGDSYPSDSTVARLFGTWSEAIKEAKLPDNSITKQHIIEIIQSFYSTEGRVPTHRDFLCDKYPSSYIINNIFGSWNSAIKAAKLSTNNNVVWTEELIIEAIHNFYYQYNRIPTAIEFKTPYPSRGTVERYFGSWNNAVEVAGFTITTSSHYGIATCALDQHLYRSKAEAYFVDTYLFGKYDYIIEPRYPEPHNKYYDWYIPKLDLYIELDGGLRPNTIKEKIQINKSLSRNLLVINIKNIYRKDFTFLE